MDVLWILLHRRGVTVGCVGKGLIGRSRRPVPVGSGVPPRSARWASGRFLTRAIQVNRLGLGLAVASQSITSYYKPESRKASRASRSRASQPWSCCHVPTTRSNKRCRLEPIHPSLPVVHELPRGQRWENSTRRTFWLKHRPEVIGACLVATLMASSCSWLGFFARAAYVRIRGGDTPSRGDSSPPSSLSSLSSLPTKDSSRCISGGSSTRDGSAVPAGS